jgi:hypothetical protein
MNEKNVLVRHAEWIRRAENIGSYGDEQGWCIADLAAEVQLLRARDETSLLRIRRLQETVLEDITTIEDLRRENALLAESPRLYRADVTTDEALRAWMRRMEHASTQSLDVRLATALACVTELELDNDGLRRQLALQEPDATLGRGLREMPGSYQLCRRASDHQRPWLCVPIWEDTSLYPMSEYFDTPEAALEAAHEGDCHVG